MQVAHHYFENGIAYFTRRINRCISMGTTPISHAIILNHWHRQHFQHAQTAKSRLLWDTMRTSFSPHYAPFAELDIGNRFLRWRAIQDASFLDSTDGVEKIWSESNVSEDFDMALRLMMKGYTIRLVDIPNLLCSAWRFMDSWATYSKGGFKEGVSLSVDDELNRWQKYAYGQDNALCSALRDYS